MPMDTGLFTPLGLQPTAVCRLGFNAAGRWLSAHGISHRRLLTDYDTGFVVWSAQLSFGEPVTFFDTDSLEMNVMARIRGGGTQFECQIDLDGATGTGTHMQAVCVPLRLDGDGALSGTPARLRPELLTLFRAGEIDPCPHLSPLPGLRATIEREATLVARGRAPFVIHRHQCEVADQWYWPEAVSLASDAREELVRAEAVSETRLRQSLQRPLRRLDLLFHRPFFLFDEGVVISSGYESQGRLAFIHELVGSEGGEPRAVVIEQWQ
jgi:acyl-CoA thioesterase FadM